MNNINNDTIVAVATPHGMGGIAVIRVSGEDSCRIVGKCWQGATIDSMTDHTAHLGHLLDGQGNLLDQVVLTLFKAPHSFTGEDVIEISCHGSLWIQQQIVNTLIDAGCRAATGGEFTQRAFGNGKIDLSQAEAIADVIASSSRASHRVAMNQMRGAFSRQLAHLRAQLLHFVSLIELELDFSEEDVNFADRGKLLALATGIKDTIQQLADSYRNGNAIKNGLPVTIVGQTNAGKSTLLNALLHDDRALVSDIQGTTRDVIEDTIVVGGTLFRFIDTAGIREAGDQIESMGIELTFKKLNEAQLVLWVIDATDSVTDIEAFGHRILPHCEGKQLIPVVNKVDLIEADAQNAITTALPGNPVFISAKNEINMQTLQQRIVEAAALPEVNDDALIVTNARHYEALTRAASALGRAVNGLQNAISGDFVSQDIRECMHYLGEITGEITTDNILEEIFTHFCIGK